MEEVLLGSKEKNILFIIMLSPPRYDQILGQSQYPVIMLGVLKASPGSLTMHRSSHCGVHVQNIDDIIDDIIKPSSPTSV